jgi:hypothetical protein
VSLLAHPERNIFITGRVQSVFADVAKMLSVRLGRRVCDIQVESRKRKLLALSAIFSSHSGESSHYRDVLKECTNRRNLIACLDFESLAAIEQYIPLLHRFYVVVLLDEPRAEESVHDESGNADSPNDLPCDLQLHWSGFQPRQLARIITHCLYG